MEITHYDIIGDTHGHADKLIDLLQKMGYRKHDGIYRQSGHQAIFVGDFIDRGGQEQQVLDIVRAMISAGHARAIMGNHEFNAICYHTPDGNGGHLRSHSSNHTRQHQAFLDEYPLGDEKTCELIDWFKTLPLFLEIDGFRVIHASWDSGLIEKIKPHLDENNCLKPEHYRLASEKGSFLYRTVETLLKGPELTLPENSLFTDKDGTPRHNVRVQWWLDELLSFRQAAVASDNARSRLPDVAIPENTDIALYPDDAPPVFFGHYWFSGQPQPVKHNAACLDYSAARDGALVGYRFEKNKKAPLSPENFYQSDY